MTQWRREAPCERGDNLSSIKFDAVKNVRRAARRPALKKTPTAATQRGCEGRC